MIITRMKMINAMLGLSASSIKLFITILILMKPTSKGITRLI